MVIVTRRERPFCTASAQVKGARRSTAQKPLDTKAWRPTCANQSFGSIGRATSHHDAGEQKRRGYQRRCS